MKAKVLLSTAALTLAVGGSGPAAAQSGYGEAAQNHHSTMQKQGPLQS